MLAVHFPGFRVTGIDCADDRIRIDISVNSNAAKCPDCGSMSTSVHSSYPRRLRDLPILGKPVEVTASVRRFRCTASGCSRATFVESLDWLARRHAQRTQRVTVVLRSLVSLLSSTLGAVLAFLLGIRTSSSTLLRTVDRSHNTERAPRFIGIDDFAIRRGKTYGTLLCDLETGRPIDIIPGRAAGPVAEWLSRHSGIQVVARDRATAYAQAVSHAAPDAMQVADRFHLVRNVGDAFREVVDGRRWVVPVIPAVSVAEVRATSPERERPTKHELARLASAQRLQDRCETVRGRFRNGESIRAISRATGLSRPTVRKYLRDIAVLQRAPRPPVPGKVTPFADYMRRRWEAGCHNATQLFREISALGYDGSRSQVKAFVQPWRAPVSTAVMRHAAWKDVRWAILCPPERRNLVQQELAAESLDINPDLRAAHDLLQQFRAILRERRAENLSRWIEQASASAFPSFKRLAKTFSADFGAVMAGVEHEWSTGGVEGQITRVKLLKRIGYGRSGFDLLRARILAAPCGRRTCRAFSLGSVFRGNV